MEGRGGGEAQGAADPQKRIPGSLFSHGNNKNIKNEQTNEYIN
jgi:hypothetical protein